MAGRKARSKKILTGLRKQYPDADCALNYSNALELLIATILSAQCTDERVNIVTADLFKKYKKAADFTKAKPAKLEEEIRSTGFFRQKTKSILGACKLIDENHGGKVPQTMDELTALPGVARKTANVVLGTFFGQNEGFVVDTHVGRLSHRLKLSWRSRDTKDAEKIEKDLMEIVPQKEWTYLGHALIWHGRRVCYARKPDCEACGLQKHCPTAFQWGK
jgi:endonuclease-3